MRLIVGCLERGGREDLWDLAALDQTLAKKTKRNGAGGCQNSAWSTGHQRDDAQRVVARLSSEKPRPHARGTLRGFRGGFRGEGLNAHDEPQHLGSCSWRRLATQKKSPVASERDEEAREGSGGGWLLASTLDALCSSTRVGFTPP